MPNDASEELRVVASTPRLWPEGSIPTPAQLSDWLVVCTSSERLHFARNALRAADESSRCFVEDHDGYRRCIENRRHAEAEALSDEMTRQPTPIFDALVGALSGVPR